MPVATIPVHRYSVQTGANTVQPFSWIKVSGPVLAHGIQNDATLYFSPSYTHLSGHVLNVGGLNFDGITVIAMIPFSEFDRMYDLVRSEAPVQLYYTYASGTTTTRQLNLAAFRSGDEPAGEGPEDDDAVAAAVSALVAASTVDLAPAVKGTRRR
ncbi:hypothetical protein OEB99_08005 [Actinotalea sp. M2MS4P-6]|uniref:hypothetical protein n=1 Tax=Actinotalea sp. M2MS4P-6 TaxID=2983762 RepID=UPI0021E3B367|nr:hypothetical protein [Actinotalea sp. M2MS4P-6]MCV2394248.1 hypothetical protein [Actinotalea sp. M2MS4P-6]